MQLGAPAYENVPAGQAVQAVETAAAKEPAGQVAQTPAPGPAALPAGQSEHDVAPAGAYVPARHLVQPAALDVPPFVTAPAKPGAQMVQLTTEALPSCEAVV